MHFEFPYFYSVLIHLELERSILSYAPVIPLKTIPFGAALNTICLIFSTPREQFFFSLNANKRSCQYSVKFSALSLSKCLL